MSEVPLTQENRIENLFDNPIILFHIPPMCMAFGGLKIQENPVLCNKCFTSSVSEATISSAAAPTKLAPWSDRIIFTGPLNAKNLRRDHASGVILKS